ncbi:MAG: thiamine phosphate synthase [Neisseriales bacterium]|nr:MAG: thiamine phosphate synthase [Neisseriales bacterium]
MQKNTDALQCYLVLDATVCGSEKNMLAIACAAVDAGITMIQLRMKNWSAQRCMALARQVKHLLSDRSIPLIINDDIEIALAVDAAGIHVGQQDLPPQKVRALVGSEKWLGLSISSEKELMHLPAHYIDYLGVGPIFQTASKKDAVSPIGLTTLEHIVKLVYPMPVVAIGGINRAHIQTLRKTGIRGIAVIAAICCHPNPGEATRQLVRDWRMLS